MHKKKHNKNKKNKKQKKCKQTRFSFRVGKSDAVISINLVPVVRVN